MIDLLSSLIFPPVNTPAVARPDQTPVVLVPSATTAPKPCWKDPYYPSRGRSPLRHEYVVPGAWPDETHVESVDAQTPCSLEEGGCGADESEDAEEYKPEYATYLIATAASEDKLQQRRENEELYRVRYADDKRWDREDETRQWMFEEMLCKDIKRACRGHNRTLKVSAEMGQKSTAGWARDGKADEKLRMGRGTPGHKGHEKMQDFFRDTMMKKRKREAVEEDGEADEAEAETRKRKRPRKMPRGILKSRLARKNRTAGQCREVARVQ